MNIPAEGTHLGNWRETPNNRRTFHHVRELIPTANIHNNPSHICVLERNPIGLEKQMFSSHDGKSRRLDEVLTQSWTDAFLVMHQGSIVFEWYAPHYDGTEPHILFSVSKSVTGALTGVLIEQGRLDEDEAVSTYIPDATGSAYGDCTLRHVLDMQVGLEFVEIYTGGNDQFNRYRTATGWNPPGFGEAAGDLRSFLTSLGRSHTPHGSIFAYMSPNTDMLGLILEAASGERLWDLISRYIWRPMGAESDAYITVDGRGAPRAAGGICVHLRDLARLGQVMCNGGQFNGNQIIPAEWVRDTSTHGSYEAWQKGGFSNLLPAGRYRNQWYQTGNPEGVICAIGIHGQWIYSDSANEVVIVKQSSQPDPVNDFLDMVLLDLYGSISDMLGSDQ